MRKDTLVIALVILGFFTAALLLTMALLTGQQSFYLLAIWATTSSLLAFCAFTHRMYRLVGNRTRQTNELLRELRLLQERRYDQLAGRLDAPKVGFPDASNTARQSMMVELSELEQMNVRLQRAERRVMGQLENEALASDRKNREWERLVTRLSDEGTSDKQTS